MDTTPGSVAVQVSRLNNPVRSSSASLARHGIAEHGRRPRQLSRDSRRASNSRTRVTGRATPAGPQEQMEWTDALERCNDKIDSLERSNRQLAQTIAQVNTESAATRSRMQDIVTDIIAYKEFVGSVHNNMEKVVTHTHLVS